MANAVTIWKDFSWIGNTVLNYCKRKYFSHEKNSRNELLDKEKSQGNDTKLTFNATYYPVFRHLKNPLNGLHVILVCGDDHKRIIPKVPIIDFKNNKYSKSDLVRAALPDM